MKKLARYKKVVKWKNQNGGEILDNKNVLIFMFISMIPIIGQITWIFFLINALIEREVYWEKIKK